LGIPTDQGHRPLRHRGPTRRHSSSRGVGVGARVRRSRCGGAWARVRGSAWAGRSGAAAHGGGGALSPLPPAVWSVGATGCPIAPSTVVKRLHTPSAILVPLRLLLLLCRLPCRARVRVPLLRLVLAALPLLLLLLTCKQRLITLKSAVLAYSPRTTLATRPRLFLKQLSTKPPTRSQSVHAHHVL